jgi:hypothetical protein
MQCFSAPKNLPALVQNLNSAPNHVSVQKCTHAQL